MAGAAEGKTAKGIVARGRTVVTDKGRKGPGETVDLAEDEIKELRARGFLVDPEAEEVKEASGPTFERG
jgi:hypothetical protein